MGFRVSAPASNTGYNRSTDWPVAGGVAAQIDGVSAGFGGGIRLKNSTIGGGMGQWHPTVAYMLGFVVAELVLFHLLSHTLNI